MHFYIIIYNDSLGILIGIDDNGLNGREVVAVKMERQERSEEYLEDKIDGAMVNCIGE